MLSKKNETGDIFSILNPQPLMVCSCFFCSSQYLLGLPVMTFIHALMQGIRNNNTKNIFIS